MGPWTAQDSRMEHARELDVVDISCPPGDETNVLAPLDRRAHVTLRCLAYVLHLSHSPLVFPSGSEETWRIALIIG